MQIYIRFIGYIIIELFKKMLQQIRQTALLDSIKYEEKFLWEQVGAFVRGILGKRLQSSTGARQCQKKTGSLKLRYLANVNNFVDALVQST